MVPSRSPPAESVSSPQRWNRISSFVGKQPSPELPTHSSHITQSSIKDLESRDGPILDGNATGGKPIPSKGPENLESKEKPVQDNPSERETNDDDIRQRSPPGRSLPLDEHSSYQEGSILSGERFASPSTDPSLRPLVPRTPTQGDRYTRKRSPPDAVRGSEFVFRCGPRPIPKVNNLPDEWAEDVHPKGQLLYSRVLSSCNLKIRVHTDLALRKTENHMIIKGATDRLLETLDSSPDLHDAGLVGNDLEACILVREDHPDEFGYYLANHQYRTVFWLEKVKPRDVDMWAYNEDMYRQKLAEQYWRHVTDYPHHCSLSEQLGPPTFLGVVDQEIHSKTWREMMHMFPKERDKIFVQSPVVFAGAMAFMAILVQAHQADSNTGTTQHPSLVASFTIACGIACCSFSVGSLVVASNLQREFKGKISKVVREASSYLQSLSGSSLGYLKLGIHLSLPRVPFQRVIVMFCGGLVILAYQLHQAQMAFLYVEMLVVLLLIGVILAGRFTVSPAGAKCEDQGTNRKVERGEVLARALVAACRVDEEQRRMEPAESDGRE